MKQVFTTLLLCLLLVGVAAAQGVSDNLGATYINGVRQGTGGGATWGSIQGNISDQADLWYELTNRYTKAESDALFLTTNSSPVMVPGTE